MRHNEDKPRADLIPADWVVICSRVHSKYLDGEDQNDRLDELSDVLFGLFSVNDGTFVFSTGVMAHIDVALTECASIIYANNFYNDNKKSCVFESVCAVMAKGEEKYETHNWAKGMNYTTVLGSINRHLHAIYTGEDTDQESGQPHLAHIMTNLLFLKFYDDVYGDKFNDLPKLNDKSE